MVNAEQVLVASSLGMLEHMKIGTVDGRLQTLVRRFLRLQDSEQHLSIVSALYTVVYNMGDAQIGIPDLVCGRLAENRNICLRERKSVGRVRSGRDPKTDRTEYASSILWRGLAIQATHKPHL